ncbi:MAG TPA: hypothetical protein VGC42_07430, partial [Kofleriaceae bacterium]
AMGDPNWQARVWRAIEQGEVETRATKSTGKPWFAGSLLATAMIAVIIGWFAVGGEASMQVAQIEIVPRRAERGGSALQGRVGDSVHVRATAGSDVRVYRERELVRWCGPGVRSEGCSVDGKTLTVEVEARVVGAYHVIVVWPSTGVRRAPLPAPGTDMAADLAALYAIDGNIQLQDLDVR